MAFEKRLKYCIVVPDGSADHPQEDLKGRTPLDVARTPNIDRVAMEGRIGLVQTIPQGFPPASDVANLSLLGFDPKHDYTGRAPLEAAAMGVELAPTDWAFRCNLITVFKGELTDYAAGHITTREAKILIDFLNSKLATESIHFYPGLSYRHLLVLQGEDFSKLQTVPPHDIIGKNFEAHLPRGKNQEMLIELMGKAAALLEDHDVNAVRRDLGENPANMIWLWGEGQKPDLPSFAEKFGVTGAAISAVDLIRGIAIYIGWDLINVPGATGYLDTNYAGKGSAAIEALGKYDLVFVHIEAPDEASHNGDVAEKIRAIESIDREIVGPVLEVLESKYKPFRLLVVPDHATPIESRTHSDEPVPFAMCGEGLTSIKKVNFTEANAKGSDLFLESGRDLMTYFLGREEKAPD